jgi:hypothetical protein
MPWNFFNVFLDAASWYGRFCGRKLIVSSHQRKLTSFTAVTNTSTALGFQSSTSSPSGRLSLPRNETSARRDSPEQRQHDRGNARDTLTISLGENGFKYLNARIQMHALISGCTWSLPETISFDKLLTVRRRTQPFGDQANPRASAPFETTEASLRLRPSQLRSPPACQMYRQRSVGYFQCAATITA